MGTRVETSYLIVPVGKLLEKFGATVQELSTMLTIDSFEDMDGGSFDGVLMKDELSNKRLHVWIEHRAELSDHSLSVENHLRPGQGDEVQNSLRARLLQARPKRGQGAEKLSQPPTPAEVRDMLLRSRGAGPALSRGDVDDKGPAEDSDDESANERERVVEVSTVTPSRAPTHPAGAGQHKKLRTGNGGAWSTAKRQRSAGPFSSSSSGRPAERRARVEIIDGEAGEEADSLSVETAKLDIGDILMRLGPPARAAIYHMVGASGQTGEHSV